MTDTPLSLTEVHLGTTVTMTVIHPTAESRASLDRAFAWFREVEAVCSRFDPQSELRRLCASPGDAVPASDLLFEAIRFAVAMAEESDGAFDPTVGGAMASRGFDRHYATGVTSTVDMAIDVAATWRDVECDPLARTVTLTRPLLLDLGGVAKGLAIDLAVRELRSSRNFAVDAGGDLYLGGCNHEGLPWSVGVRHPREAGAVIDVWAVTDAAVCTSGDYERAATQGHHLLDPRTGHSAEALASATVLAPTAMLADAAATAAFVLGPRDGRLFCERLGLSALLLTADLARHETGALPRQ